MCSVYSFCSVSIIICIWHIPFLWYTPSHVFGIFLLFYAYYHMCLAYSIRFVCIIICVPSIPFIFFEYPKISCVQWQKAQVLVYFCSWIIEEAITRTNSLENIFTIVNPTMGGANTPWCENFGLKTALRPSAGQKGIPCQISLHLVVSCPNA